MTLNYCTGSSGVVRDITTMSARIQAVLDRSNFHSVLSISDSFADAPDRDRRAFTECVGDLDETSISSLYRISSHRVRHAARVDELERDMISERREAIRKNENVQRVANSLIEQIFRKAIDEAASEARSDSDESAETETYVRTSNIKIHDCETPRSSPRTNSSDAGANTEAEASRDVQMAALRRDLFMFYRKHAPHRLRKNGINVTTVANKYYGSQDTLNKRLLKIYGANLELDTRSRRLGNGKRNAPDFDIFEALARMAPKWSS